jgi:D-beta-D-heptose 7-phosphate kinase/D-beta-D-heptose 1-phosphate adenosyltransferase
MVTTISSIGQEYDGKLLKAYVDRFPDAKVLVIGDVIMDEYIWGDVSRISPEAPVPVVEVKRETKMLGGAANVIHNLAALGAKPILCGVVGEDRTGQEILETIHTMNLPTDGILTESGRPTSIKTRIVAHNQQVVRFDRESKREISLESVQRLLHFIESRLKIVDAVLVSDYGKGVISASFMTGLRAVVRKSSAAIAVDPKTDNFEFYEGVDVITPNHQEAGVFCRFEITDEESLIRAGNHIVEALKCRSVLITQGKDGMTLFEKSGEISHIPTVARKVFDVTGAGDTVIGTFCLGLASGLDLKSSAILSNFAAGIVVGEVGTSVVRSEDLKKTINGRVV